MDFELSHCHDGQPTYPPQRTPNKALLQACQPLVSLNDKALYLRRVRQGRQFHQPHTVAFYKKCATRSSIVHLVNNYQLYTSIISGDYVESSNCTAAIAWHPGPASHEQGLQKGPVRGAGMVCLGGEKSCPKILKLLQDAYTLPQLSRKLEYPSSTPATVSPVQQLQGGCTFRGCRICCGYTGGPEKVRFLRGRGDRHTSLKYQRVYQHHDAQHQHVIARQNGM